MDTRLILEEKIEAINKLSDAKKTVRLDHLVNQLDDLEVVSDDPSKCASVVKTFTELLLNEATSPLRPLHRDQLEAIAYLTGYIHEKLPKRMHDNYAEENALSGAPHNQFKNINYYVVILQLIARVIDPKRINQREEQVCGVNALLTGIAKDEPLTYVKFVMDLMRQGEADLSLRDATSSLSVKMPKDQFAHPARASNLQGGEDPIADADFIGLIGFRASQNAFFSYPEKGGDVAKTVFGVSSYSEPLKWMEKIGLMGVRNFKLDSRQNIMRANRLIADGYMCLFTTTGFLARYDEHDKAPSWLAKLLQGHFVYLSNITIDNQENVVVEMSTWGEKIRQVMPYGDFVKYAGFAEVSAGITRGQWNQLCWLANRISSERVSHPITYARELQSAILSEEWGDLGAGGVGQALPHGAFKQVPRIFKDILQQLAKAPLHREGKSWMEEMVDVQVALISLQQDKAYLSFLEKYPHIENKLKEIVSTYAKRFLSVQGDYLPPKSEEPLWGMVAPAEPLGDFVFDELPDDVFAKSHDMLHSLESAALKKTDHHPQQAVDNQALQVEAKEKLDDFKRHFLAFYNFQVSDDSSESKQIFEAKLKETNAYFADKRQGILNAYRLEVEALSCEHRVKDTIKTLHHDYRKLKGRHNDDKVEALQRLLDDKSKTPEELVYAMLKNLATLLHHYMTPHPLVRLIMRSERTVEGFIGQLNRHPNRHRYARLLARALKRIEQDYPDMFERIKKHRESGQFKFNYEMVVNMLDRIHPESESIRPNSL